MRFRLAVVGALGLVAVGACILVAVRLEWPQRLAAVFLGAAVAALLVGLAALVSFAPRLRERALQLAVYSALSAGGLAFHSQHEISTGSLLEMRMVLFPSLVGILSLSRVIHCERVSDTNVQFSWQLAIAFAHLLESDRELLVRHVMAKQTRALRAERLEDD